MILKILFAVLIILIILMVGVIACDSNRFVMREYTIFSDKVERDHDFLFLSDLHNKSYGRNNLRLKNAISGVKAEACFMTGDMMTARPGASFNNALDLVEFVKSLMPVYYSYGNHEQRAEYDPKLYDNMFEKYSSKLLKSGVVISGNSYFRTDDIDIYTLNLDRGYYVRFKTNFFSEKIVESYLGKPDPNRFSVLLAHNPEFSKSYAKWGADLVLSGHYHGGVVRIPGIGGVISPKFRLFPKYDGGFLKEGNSYLAISRGLGAHTIPLRAFNPGEIIVLHIKRVEKA